MPSEFAKEIAYAVAITDADQPSPEVAIDAELQEVREVLDALRFMKGGCWCVAAPASTIEAGFRHTKTCQCARSLYARLRVDGGKENDGS